ncbi:MAG: DUF2071 domain-containing protein [Acidimicrobiales bacterium]
MLTNAVDCTIERRLLVNYRIDPEVVMRQLPAPFRPQLVSGLAVGGVCFIRLGGLRPARIPSALGMTTENVAHRFAVEWDGDQGTQVGVFIPRRDTNSRITALAGDKIFPGVHHLARFSVHEHGSDLRIGVESRDGTLGLSVVAHEATSLGGGLFGALEDAVAFFRRGSLGYSPSAMTDRLMGVRLQSQRWDARPVTVEHMASTMFDNTSLFPKGSCTLDFGLVMRNLAARWLNEGPLNSRSEVRVA